ncbi:MAG: ATP-binding protein [Candidatus Bathyarchaeota archaeon]
MSLFRSFWFRIEGKREDISPALIRFLVKLFTLQTSTFIIIFGRRGTGKTDLGLLIIEILYRIGIIKHVSTNTKILDSPFPIKEITNLEDLKYWGENNRGRKLFLFDEIAKAMPRRRPMSRLNVELINKFQVLRKHKLSVVATTINEDILDSMAMRDDTLDARFIKKFFPSGHKLKCKIAYFRHLLTDEEITLTDLPSTSVKFDSWDSSPFTEKPLSTKPVFKDKDMELVYRWALGETYKELGVHRQKLTRAKRKIIKFFIENQRHMSHNKERGT